MSVAVSVVIPTYNRGSEILPTVESLLRSELAEGVEGELIVVNDGSETGRYRALGCLPVPPWWKLSEQNKKNGGPASARNFGLARASGEIVLFVDDDILGRNMIPTNPIRRSCFRNPLTGCPSHLAGPQSRLPP